MAMKKVEITISSRPDEQPRQGGGHRGDPGPVTHTETLDTSCPSIWNSWALISSRAESTAGSSPGQQVLQPVMAEALRVGST